MTNFSFGRTDERTERGNNNIPELSLESAGIITSIETSSYTFYKLYSRSIICLVVMSFNAFIPCVYRVFCFLGQFMVQICSTTVLVLSGCKLDRSPNGRVFE